MSEATVYVYLKYGGAKYSYKIEAPDDRTLTAKAREHVGKILENGYRHCSNGELIAYKPHYIDKIKAIGNIKTDYPDISGGT
ncbi:MAG: hypothetical protein ACOCP8_08825 [archaeon]